MSWIKTNNGIELKDTGDILADVQNAFKSVYPNLNLDPSTPQGQIITYITECIRNAQGDLVELANVFQNGGDGVFLDIRNHSLFGINRKLPTKGSVVATITGQSGTAIKQGFKACAGDKVFATNYPVTITGNGSVDVTMIAEKEGDWQIQAGELNEFVTMPVPVGVESITNKTSSIAGQGVETDYAYRQRAKTAVFHESCSVFGGLLSRLKQINGVVNAGGYENISDEIIEWKGTNMPAHSINVICKGGTEEEIAECILKYKNPGCDLGGDVVVNVYEPESQQAYEVKFYRPVEANIHAEIKVRIGNNVTQNYIDEVKNALCQYINGLSFGADIYLYEASAAIDIPNLKVITFDLWEETTGKTGATTISLSFLQEPILLADNIVVTVDTEVI